MTPEIQRQLVALGTIALAVAAYLQYIALAYVLLFVISCYHRDDYVELFKTLYRLFNKYILVLFVKKKIE